MPIPCKTCSPHMSALGHKRTCAVQNGMSALTPKADIVAPALFDAWQLHFLNERRIVARCP